MAQRPAEMAQRPATPQRLAEMAQDLLERPAPVAPRVSAAPRRTEPRRAGAAARIQQHPCATRACDSCPDARAPCSAAAHLGAAAAGSASNPCRRRCAHKTCPGARPCFARAGGGSADGVTASGSPRSSGAGYLCGAAGCSRVRPAGLLPVKLLATPARFYGSPCVHAGRINSGRYELVRRAKLEEGVYAFDRGSATGIKLPLRRLVDHRSAF